MKLSFIVIGYNEGVNLKRCFDSIKKTIAILKFKEDEYECIYVDSNSSDDSVNIAKNYEWIKIFLLTKDRNAAIARNVGAENAKGKYLFFLDGDMEIDLDNIACFLTETIKKHPFVSGNFTNYYYSPQGKFLKKEIYKKYLKDKDYFSPYTGGVFLIKKNLWNKLGGMKPYMKTGEDLDLSLRLAKIGKLQFRKNLNLVNHHTVSYRDRSRILNNLLSINSLFSRSVLYRNNLLNRYIIKRVIYSEPCLLYFVFSIFASVSFFRYSWISYWLIMIILYKFRFNKVRLIDLLAQTIRDVKVLLGFFFFYPSKPNVNYKEL